MNRIYKSLEDIRDVAKIDMRTIFLCNHVPCICGGCPLRLRYPEIADGGRRGCEAAYRLMLIDEIEKIFLEDDLK
jgi:hypothetical protein